MNFLIPLIFLLCSLHLKGDYIFTQWAIGGVILSFFIASYVGRKTSPLIGIFFGYWAAWCFLVSFFPTVQLYYLPFTVSREKLTINTLIEFACMATLALGVISLKTKTLQKVFKFLPLYGALNAIYVLVTHIFNLRLTESMGPGGVIDYSGMNGCLIALCLLPVIYEEISKHSGTLQE